MAITGVVIRLNRHRLLTSAPIFAFSFGSCVVQRCWPRALPPSVICRFPRSSRWPHRRRPYHRQCLRSRSRIRNRDGPGAAATTTDDSSRLKARSSHRVRLVSRFLSDSAFASRSSLAEKSQELQPYRPCSAVSIGPDLICQRRTHLTTQRIRSVY